MLEAKIIEPIPDETTIGLFASISTKWETNADLEALKTAGIDLRGLYVIRRSPKEDERRLVGQIADVDNGIVGLAASFGGETTVNVKEVFLEGSKASFSHPYEQAQG